MRDKNDDIKTVVRACGEKWPAVMPVKVAATYVGMTDYKLRRIPQLANLFRIVWDSERVWKEALDEVVRAVMASQE